MDISLRGVNACLGWFVLGLLMLILPGLLAAQGCAPSAPESAPEVGHLAPDFTLTDLEGNSVTLSAVRGKVVFINFWATWCPPCRKEMPEIEAIYQEYKNQDVVVIGVDLLVSEIFKGYDENDVHQFVQQGGYSWTFVIDTTGQVAENYGITAIPTSFLPEIWCV